MDQNQHNTPLNEIILMTSIHIQLTPDYFRAALTYVDH